MASQLVGTKYSLNVWPHTTINLSIIKLNRNFKLLAVCMYTGVFKIVHLESLEQNNHGLVTLDQAVSLNASCALPVSPFR